MSSEHLSELSIARGLLGQVSAEEARRLEAHAGACAPCAAELEQAQAARARFLQDVLPRTLPALEGRLLRRRWLAGVSLAAVAGTAAIALLVARTDGAGQAGSPAPALAVKGSGALRMYARRDGRVFLVGAATVLRPGDQIRFAVQSGGARYVLIASLDGAGQANVYYPSRPIDDQPSAGWQLLPDSIVLDQAPGPERVFAVFSPVPVDQAAVGPLLQAAARGQLPLPYVQSSVSIEKEVPSAGGQR
jgi:hypothetical protein